MSRFVTVLDRKRSGAVVLAIYVDKYTNGCLSDFVVGSDDRGSQAPQVATHICNSFNGISASAENCARQPQLKDTYGFP